MSAASSLPGSLRIRDRRMPDPVLSLRRQRRSCPYCFEPIRASEHVIHTCACCGTQVHETCARELGCGSCPILGCEGIHRRPAREIEQEASSPAWKAWSDRFCEALVFLLELVFMLLFFVPPSRWRSRR